MVTPDNIYTQMQKNEYNRGAHIMNIEDHAIHNQNPDYWNILLGPIRNDPEPWVGLNALDFGCGTGRNVRNMAGILNWGQVCGTDISENNLVYARQRLADLPNVDFRLSDGVSIPYDDEYFSFIMSTIVLQHICVYDIRKSILNDMWRVLDYGGCASLQMGFGTGHPSSLGYGENFWEAQGTNSQMDVRVEHESQLIADLYDSGFSIVTHEISHSWSDSHHEWIYVQAIK